MNLNAFVAFPFRAAYRLVPTKLHGSLFVALISALVVPILNLVTAAAVLLLIFSLQNSSLEHCQLCFLVPYNMTEINPVVSAALFLSVSTVVSYFLEWLHITNNRNILRETEKHLILALSKKYLSIPWLSFSTDGRAKCMRNCTTTAFEAARAIGIVMDLIRSSSNVIILSLGFMIQAPLLGSNLLIIVLLTIFILRQVLQPKLRRAGKEVHDGMGELHKRLTHTFEAGREVRVYKVQSCFLKPIETVLTKICKAEVDLDILPRLTSMLIEGGVTLIIAFSVLIFVIFNDSGYQAVLLADLGMIIVLSMRLIPSVMGFVSALNRLPSKSINIHHISMELALPEEKLMTGANPLYPPSAVEHLLQMRGLSFAYSNHPPILQDIDLDVVFGDRIALLGPSGSGKSTLLMLAAGLCPPTQGFLMIRDINHVAYVPQDTVLLDDTILANILFGLEKVDEVLIWRVLADVQLDVFVRHLPQGLNSIVGDNGALLSGGQRQRLGIARALYRRPRLLIMDESTSALDAHTESRVMEAIVRSKDIHAVIFATHRLAAARKASRCFNIERGKLTAYYWDNGNAA